MSAALAAARGSLCEGGAERGAAEAALAAGRARQGAAPARGAAGGAVTRAQQLPTQGGHRRRCGGGRPLISLPEHAPS